MFLYLLIGVCVLQNDIALSHQSILLDSCKTAQNQLGQCIAIDKCPQTLQLVKVHPISENIKNYLLSIQCGFEKKIPKVCCDISDDVAYENTHTASPLPEFDMVSKFLPRYNVCGVSIGYRIISEITEVNEFAWIAALQYTTPSGLEFHCGGALINERYILTAAHCVTNLPKGWTLTSVRLGEYDIKKDIDCIEEYDELICNDPPINLKIEASLVHEEFNPDNNQNDVALLRLDKFVQFTDFVRPVCLPTFPDLSKTDLENSYLTRAGWGFTKNSIESNIKQKFSVPLTSNNECLTKNQNISLTDKQFCVGRETRNISCRGDSGGAVMDVHYYSGGIYWYVAGIESFSPINCIAENPSAIYTSVIDYIPWIISKLK